MIDATHLKAHRTASSLRGKKGVRKRFIGRTKGGLNSKLHAVTDGAGRPISMYLSAGQTSDYIGARALLASLPKAGTLLADRGYDADWFRNALIERDIQPCIPSRRGRPQVPSRTTKTSIANSATSIENMFARLKD